MKPNNFKLTPSLMTCDLMNVEKEILTLKELGIDWYHFDLMDGKYVPNLGMCPDLLEQIKTKYPEITIDAHCMVNDIMPIYNRIKLADYITIHVSSIQRIGLYNLINFLKSENKKIGLAFELDDSLDILRDGRIINNLDLITIMSIKSGFAGQTFKEETWDRIKEIQKLIQGHKILLQLDGGIRWNNIQEVIDSGIDLLVVGHLLFESKDYQKTINKIYQGSE